MTVRARRATPRLGVLQDLTAARIVRALGARLRYRYVQPHVQAVPQGWLITSPCCSRNVDPEGGDIPIAWIECTKAGAWRVHAYDHVHRQWVAHADHNDLPDLMQAVCADVHRVFWP
jgi:hypothetical protein